MTQPAKGQEPSMEEILASIRRIIADDDSAKPPLKAAEPAPPAPPSAAAQPPRPATLPPRMPDPPARQAAAAPSPAPLGQHEIDAVMAQPEPLPEPTSDILDLTEQMAAAPEEPPSESGFRTIDGHSDLVFEDAAPPPPEPPPARPMADQIDRGLVSSATTAAVDSAFNTLAQTVLVQNARTLEDLVREMLRPMLKTWLDDNLPGLVERLVRAEIERVSRGRG